MEEVVTKSKFKPRALEYFREVEKSGKEIIITDRGKPVVKIIPFSRDIDKILKNLRNTVMKYDDPTSPVAKDDWEALK